MPVTDGRDTVEMIESQAAEIGALRAYAASQDAAVAGISAGIAEQCASIAEERAAWQGKLHTLSKEVKRLRSPWAVGLFGGWDAVHRQPVVGIGLTYKLIGL